MLEAHVEAWGSAGYCSGSRNRPESSQCPPVLKSVIWQESRVQTMPEVDIQDVVASIVEENWEWGGFMLACRCTLSLSHAKGWLRLVLKAGPGGHCCPEQIKKSLALLPATYPGTWWRLSSI